MSNAVEEPTDRRGDQEAPRPAERRDRSRLAVPVLAGLSMLFFATALATATDVGSLLGADRGHEHAASRLSPAWASLDPLLPLAPSLRDMAALKRAADRRLARTLAARGGGAALRLSPRPGQDGGAAASVASDDSEPSRLARRARPAAPIVGLTAPVPAVRRAVAPVVRALPSLPDLLSSGGGVVPTLPRLPRPPAPPRLPTIDPLPGGVGLPTVNPLPGGVRIPSINPLPRGVLSVTVTDLASDPSFDVLIASFGQLPAERYVFADGDVAGLAAQINLHSRLLVADALRDGAPLAHVLTAPVGLSARAAAVAAALGPGGAAWVQALMQEARGAGVGAGASAAGSGGGARFGDPTGALLPAGPWTTAGHRLNGGGSGATPSRPRLHGRHGSAGAPPSHSRRGSAPERSATGHRGSRGHGGHGRNIGRGHRHGSSGRAHGGDDRSHGHGAHGRHHAGDDHAGRARARSEGGNSHGRGEGGRR
jgi:hypothetical protein